MVWVYAQELGLSLSSGGMLSNKVTTASWHLQKFVETFSFGVLRSHEPFLDPSWQWQLKGKYKAD